jgi:hypothetical protein
MSNALVYLANVFVTVSHSQPSLIFVGKAGNYPIDMTCLIHKYKTMVEVTQDLPSLASKLLT